MPVIKVQHVVSCSSEDRVHNSENMLLSDHYRKWKSAQTGEKQITILLQLEKASVIHSIDIGNEGSGFVEVLVGRSSDIKQDFQVLLLSSSFMTPTESRQNIGTNRVRMFGPDKLSQTVSKDKWDLVKIVCTQPFNKSIQYGLSFVVFHSPPEKNSDVTQQPTVQTTLGGFKMKSSEEPDNSLRVGSWFAKRKSDSQDVDLLSTPAAIKAADAPVKRPESSILSVKKRKLSNSDNSDLNTSNGLAKNRDTDEDQKQKSQEPRKSVIVETPKPSTSGISTTKIQRSSNERLSVKSENNSGSTPKRNDQVKKRPKRDIPFHKLLEGTIFALSGYQNPKRGQIRDKAIEMGAVYKPDWDKRCTHLVCAFLNTPKFQQVHSKGGRIVKESWILECSKQKKRLPWRQFMLGKSNRPETSESEDSDAGDENKPKQWPLQKSPTVSKPAKVVNPPKNDEKFETRVQNRSSSSLSNRPETSESENSNNTDESELKKRAPKKTPTVLKPFKNDDEFETRVQNRKTKSPSNTRSRSSTPDELDSDTVYEANTDVDTDSGCDTETEISKVLAKKADRQSGSETNVNTSDLDLPSLPDIFQGEHFYLYGDFTSVERKRLTRFIIGCGGVLKEYMSNDVRCVLTNSKWNQELTDSINENSLLRILKPSWVTESVDKGNILPKKDYFVPKR